VNEREALTSLLGRLVDVPAVDAWVVPLSLFPAVILPGRDEPEAPLVRDRCVVMPFLDGATAASDPAGAIAAVGLAPAAAGDLLAFMHWIGDEDRGLDDVMAVGGRLLLIDNGLCGPGRPESGLRGYHPLWEAFDAGAKLRKCYGGKRAFVEFVLRDAGLPHATFAGPPVIGRIQSLASETIRRVVGHLGLHARVAAVLAERTRHLAHEYEQWLDDVGRLFGVSPGST
jgi:hypothetical protein